MKLLVLLGLLNIVRFLEVNGDGRVSEVLVILMRLVRLERLGG